MIEMFVRTKHKIDKRHEFALVVVNDDALWVSAGTLKPAPNNQRVYAMCLPLFLTFLQKIVSSFPFMFTHI